jgi:[NiFe] hydrogenase large subunit/hydrogenase large subunit
MHAVLGGKNPHLQSFLVGGMATPVDADSQAALNTHTIAQLKSFTAKAREFVSKVYIPDLLAIASFYKDWAGHGRGVGNYLSFGDYPDDGTPESAPFIPQGIIRGRDLSKVEPFDQTKVAEYITHSWYSYQQGNDVSLHPLKGETSPNFTGPNPPYTQLDTDRKYSWLKSPRYADEPMEVGPLARMLVSYVSGHAGVKVLVDAVLKQLAVGPEALFSTLGRVAARGIETQLLADKMDHWVDALAANMAAGDHRIHDNSKWDPSSWPADAAGFGLHEAPRGSLSHWVNIHDGAIANYQCVVPSTWNAGPRDAKGRRGPYEEALLATPVADPERPIEILRTVHSFDPCMACGVHVVDARGREITKVRVV